MSSVIEGRAFCCPNGHSIHALKFEWVGFFRFRLLSEFCCLPFVTGILCVEGNV